MQRPLIRVPFVSGAASSGLALLAIRLVMGPMLAWHGYKKIEGGVENFVETVDRAGFPLPELLARGVIVLELVGGICLALGLLTRLWSGLATVQFLLIIAKIKWDVGLSGSPGRSGYELDLMYAVTAAALLIAGPGRLALDRVLGLEAEPDGSPATPREPDVSSVARSAG
jgi:putative oxidoreductase